MKSTLHLLSKDGPKFYLTILPFVLLLSSFCLKSGNLHAQQSSLPCNVITPWTPDTFAVEVDFSSTGLACWDDNFACIIAGDHPPDKVIDNNLSNFATGQIVVGGSLTLSVKDPIHNYSAGNFVGFVISSGLLDLSLFSNITLRTYLNNSAIPQETFQGFDLIGLNSTLFDDPYTLGFVTTEDYDEIEITFAAGITVGLYNVHYAIMESFCAGPDLACNQATFMNSPTYPMTIDYANTGSIGLNLGNVDDPENAISASTSDYASLNSLASVLDSLSIAIEEQVTDYPAGTFVAFDIENVSILNVALLEYMVITTYLNGVQQEQMTDDDLFLGASILNSTGRQTVGFVTGTAVDKIKFTLAQPIGVSLGTTRVYGAIFQEFCAGPPLECNVETQLNSPLFPVTIDYFNTGSSGIGIGSINNAQNAISASTIDYASLITVANVLDSLSITIEEHITDYPVGTFVGFDIENTTLVGLGLLENIVITTYLNGVEQEQLSDDDLLLGAPLLNSTGRHTVGFVASTSVDKVKFTLAQPINVNLGTTRVYSAIFREFCEGPALPCNEQIPLSSTEYPIYINTGNTGFTGAACLGCTLEDVEAVIDGDPMTFAEIDITAGVATVGSISVRKELSDYPANTFAGFQIENVQLVDVDVLVGVTISTYLDGSFVELATGTDILLTAGTDLLVNQGEFLVGFVTTSAFDEVRISLTNVGMVNIGTTKVYDAVFGAFCPATILCDTTYFLTTPEFPVYVDFQLTGLEGGVCALCEVEDPDEVITASNTDFASITITAGVLQSGSIAVRDALYVYPPGTIAGFVIEDLNDILQADLFASLTISTYLDGNLQEFAFGANLIDAEVLILFINPDAGVYNVGFQTTLPFDEVRITVGSLASVINLIDVYGAFVDTRNSSGGDSLNCPNPPVAMDDMVTTPEDMPVIINVLDNDSDPDSPLGIPVVIDPPAYGTTTYNAGDSTYTYTPDPDFVGIDSFMYAICDGGTPPLCDTATVTITVTPVMDTIIIVLPEDSTLTVCADSLTTFTEPATSIALCEAPSDGMVTIMGTCATYTPDPGFNGQDTFCVVVCDPNNPLLCDTTIVIVIVDSLNNPPVAVDDTATTPEDTPVVIDVLDNDSDPDSPLNNPTISESPDNGSVSVNPGDGTITYTPDPNFVGVDSFMYSICDNGIPILCDTALVVVTVTPVIDTIIEMIPEDSILVVCADSLTTFTEPATSLTLCDAPTNGTVIIMGVCATYSPEDNFTGMDTFCVVACDPNNPLLCDTTIVIVVVTPINDPPVAVDDSASTSEDTPVVIVVLDNDSDPDSPLNNPSITDSPNNGTTVVNPGDGSVTYTPDPDFVGVDSFMYSICDNGFPILCDTALVIVTVTPVTDTIIEVIPEDSTLVVCADSLTTFTDPATSIALCDDPSDGTITIMGTCATYMPDPGFNGQDTFCVVICDPNTPLLCDTTIVIVIVDSLNNPPVAEDDNASTPEDTPVVIDVLDNDSDPDSPLNNPTIVDPPTNGTVMVNPDGTVTYTPDPDFVGIDSFTYSICDNGMPPLCDTALVIVTVNPANDGPIAVDDAVTTPEDTPVAIDVLDNDSDIDSPLGIPVVTDPPSNGMAMVNPVDSTITYTPDPDFVGVDTFSYAICDNGVPVLCDTALVVVTVTPVTDTITEMIPEDSTLVVCADSLTTFTDPATSIALCDAPSNGTVTIMGVCATYTPDDDFTGQDTFCVVVCDPNNPLLCDTTIVIVIVTPVNDPPVAVDDAATTPEDTPVDIDVLDNDSDLDSPLGIPVVTDTPTNGMAMVNPGDSTITYTPDPDFVGVDSFSYAICDNGVPVLCDTALVVVTVVPVIDTIYETIPEDSSFTVCADSLTTFTDPATSISLCDAPSNGTVTIMGVCATYTPDDDFTGQDTFCVVVCDPNNPLLCDTTIVIVIVAPVNDPPVAVDDSATTPEDTPVVIDVLDNDSDIDSPLGIPVVTDPPTNGMAMVNPGDSTITYTPDPDFVGVDSFMYAICDAGIPVLCDTALVVVTVVPVIDTIYETIPEDSSFTVCADSLTTFSEPATSITLCEAPSQGVVTISGVCATYLPDPGYTGQDTFCLVVCAPNSPSLCDTTIVVITVLPPGCVNLHAFVYLEGAAVSSNGEFMYALPMRTTLNNVQVLPGQCYQDPFFGTMYTPPGQPYNVAPWFYNGTEGSNFDSGGDPMQGDAGYPPTVVDWIVVSLRDNPEGTGGPICQTAACLHQDGTIELIDSFACCGLNPQIPYYLVIEHRNHLIVMSDVPVLVSNDTLTYDFRSQQSYINDPGQTGIFGGQKEILPGVYAMYAGNGDQAPLPQADTDINFDDRTYWEMHSGTPGIYNTADYNLNTDTNFNDRVLWEKNNGKFTSVPRD